MHGRIADPSAPPALGAGDAPGRFTLYGRRKERLLQFEGEILAEAHTSGIAAHYRVTLYKTRDGKFIGERSLNSLPYLPGGDPRTETAAAVFDTLAAACAWFPPGSLTNRLLREVRKRGLLDGE